MKKSKIALIMTAAMAFSSMPAYAENIKQERVYVVADPSGKTQTLIDNIRLENKDGLDEITDRTMLTDIENVGGQETFTQDEEDITWQAGGNDITYQGTSDQQIPVRPVVKVSADGEEVSADALKDLSGEITLEVSYETDGDTTALAATVLPIPTEGVSDLEMTGAQLLQENGVQCVIGWGTAGADRILSDEEDTKTEDETVDKTTSETEAETAIGADEVRKSDVEEKASEFLRDSFTVSFKADHANLSWMYTVVSAEPVAALQEMAKEYEGADLLLESDDIRSILEALSAGEEVPETTGKTAETAQKINDMNQGLTDLDDGASDVADGAKAVSDGAASAAEGAAQLSSGLATLSENNQAIQDGMSTLLDAILATANEQIAASDLAAAGITVPELTQENYKEVLEGLLNQFSPDGVKAAVSEQVRAKVEENREQVEAAVDEAVKNQVLEAILKELNLEMTAEEYYEKLDAGNVPDMISQGVDKAVEGQMQSEEVQTKRNEAVEEQIESLVEEKTQEYLDSEEGQGKLASAQQAYDSVSALSTQLLQVGELKDGVDEYTNGVADASTGAAQLSEGLTQLKSGSSDLSTGSQTLSEGMTTLHTSLTDAEKQVADTILPYLESDMANIVEQVAAASKDVENTGYDLRPEDMKTITAYIIRTDF